MTSTTDITPEPFQVYAEAWRQAHGQNATLRTDYEHGRGWELEDGTKVFFRKIDMFRPTSRVRVAVSLPKELQAHRGGLARGYVEATFSATRNPEQVAKKVDALVADLRTDYPALIARRDKVQDYRSRADVMRNSLARVSDGYLRVMPPNQGNGGDKAELVVSRGSAGRGEVEVFPGESASFSGATVNLKLSGLPWAVALRMVAAMAEFSEAR